MNAVSSTAMVLPFAFSVPHHGKPTAPPQKDGIIGKAAPAFGCPRQPPMRPKHAVFHTTPLEWGTQETKEPLCKPDALSHHGSYIAKYQFRYVYLMKHGSCRMLNQRCYTPFESCFAENPLQRFERLPQVRNEILRILQAHRETNEAVGNAHADTFGGRHVAVRHGSWMLHQRRWVATKDDQASKRVLCCAESRPKPKGQLRWHRQSGLRRTSRRGASGLPQDVR